KHEWRNHFDGGLGTHLLSALTPLDAQLVGEDAQGLSNAGAKAIGLDEHGYERLDVFEPSTSRQFAQRVDASLANAHLEIHELQLVAELRVSDPEFLGHLHNRLIQAETGLDADDEQIETVRKAATKLVLTATNLPD